MIGVGIPGFDGNYRNPALKLAQMFFFGGSISYAIAYYVWQTAGIVRRALVLQLGGKTMRRDSFDFVRSSCCIVKVRSSSLSTCVISRHIAREGRGQDYRSQLSAAR